MVGKISAVIQAGGKSSRMGVDKAFVLLHGKPLIAHVLERLRQIEPDELFIIANPSDQSDQYARLNVPVIPDQIHDKGPLGGITTALEAARNPNLLVVACDMPFIDPRFLAYIVRLQREAPVPYDAIVPRFEGQAQGLHALYHKTCLPTFQTCLDNNQLRLTDIFTTLNVRYIDEAEYVALGLDARSFTNINTPEELHRATTNALM